MRTRKFDRRVEWRGRCAVEAPPPPWRCVIPFAAVQCDQILVQGASMGGCEVLNADSGQEDFFSGNMLLARRGDVFAMLEFSADVPGENGWRGRWENGVLTGLCAEVRERFSRNGKLPEIVLEIRYGKDPHVMLSDYVKRHWGPMRPCRHPALNGAGWSSWDYYRWSVTAEDVLANAEFIARDPVLAKHVTRIVIDDGWMNCYGEWEPNSRFAGLPELARELRGMGFTPGLWFAPGLAEPQSLIAQKHWEYLARGASSWPCMAFECMGRRAFLLDPTRPEVRQWLFELFRRYKAMGFEYYKLDFLQHTLRARQFSDRNASACDIIRSLLRPIREAVGQDAILMGCNHLFAAGNEYLDIVRTAADIHADFGSIRRNSISIAARTAMHESCWRNDPDFALVRGPETSDDPDMRQLRPNQVYVSIDGAESDHFCGTWSCAGTLSANEARILLSLLIVSGGEINFSDALFKLNEQGLELVRRAAAAVRGAAGKALDLMSGDCARTYVQQVDDSLVRRLWINWGEEPLKIKPVPPEGWRITDFWSGAPQDCRKLQWVIEPHSCCLLEFFREKS